MSREDYNRYLSSDKWKRKRSQALFAAGYCCENCGVSKWSMRLEVHHVTYDRLYHERMGDLKVLCSECHKKEHQWSGREYLFDHAFDDLLREPPGAWVEHPKWEHYVLFDYAMTARYGSNWSFKFSNGRINGHWNEYISGYWA